MDISEVLREDLIVFDLQSTTKKEAIVELANKLKNSGAVSDLDTYIAAVMKREEISNTGLGMNVAIPHGKSPAVNKASVVFGRSRAGVDYQSEDGEPVFLLFLIAAPQEADEHLRILGHMSRKLIHADVREKLRAAETAKEVYEALA